MIELAILFIVLFIPAGLHQMFSKEYKEAKNEIS